MTIKPRVKVLKQALKDVADRESIYGDPLQNHQRIVAMFETWREICPTSKYTPLDSIVFQILTNLARIAETPEHKGSWDNIAGYAGIGYEVVK